MKDLITRLNAAVQSLRTAEGELGSIEGSRGWNAAQKKVEEAEKAYNAVVAEIEAALTARAEVPREHSGAMGLVGVPTETRRRLLQQDRRPLP